MAIIRTEKVVLERLKLGHQMTRDRNPANGRFRVHFETVVVDDGLVAQMLKAGQIRVIPTTDPFVYHYAIATARPAEPAAAARRADPASSHAAAAGVNLKSAQRYVLQLFRLFGPMTQLELVQVHQDQVRNAGAPNLSESRIRSSCPELERLGKLRRVGKKETGHTTTSGVKTHAEVWSLPDAPPAQGTLGNPAGAGLDARPDVEVGGSVPAADA